MIIFSLEMITYKFPFEFAGIRFGITGGLPIAADWQSLFWSTFACMMQVASIQLPPHRSTPPHQSTPDKIAAHEPSTSSAVVEPRTGQPHSETISPVVADSISSFSSIEEKQSERENRMQEASWFVL